MMGNDIDALKQAQLERDQQQRLPSVTPTHQDTETTLETSYEATINGFGLSMRNRVTAAKAFIEAAISNLASPGSEMEKEKRDELVKYIEKTKEAVDEVKPPTMSYGMHRDTNNVDTLEVSIVRGSTSKSYLPLVLATAMLERIEEDNHEDVLFELLPMVQELALKLVDKGVMKRRLPEFNPELPGNAERPERRRR